MHAESVRTCSLSHRVRILAHIHWCRTPFLFYLFFAAKIKIDSFDLGIQILLSYDLCQSQRSSGKIRRLDDGINHYVELDENFLNYYDYLVGAWSTVKVTGFFSR